MTAQVHPHARQRGMAGKVIAAMTDDEMREAESPGEMIARLGNATPVDAAETLRIAWPDIWSRLARASRSAGMRPVPFLVHLLDAALEP